MTDSTFRKKESSVDPADRAEWIALGAGLRLELLFRGEHFLGLGAIEADGVTLRGSRRPMFV
jgi:hypothetical protein